MRVSLMIHETIGHHSANLLATCSVFAQQEELNHPFFIHSVYTCTPSPTGSAALVDNMAVSRLAPLFEDTAGNDGARDCNLKIGGPLRRFSRASPVLQRVFQECL